MSGQRNAPIPPNCAEHGAWRRRAATVAVCVAVIAALFAASAAQDVPPAANSMTVEDTALWADADNGFFVFHDNRAGTANDPVPDAWNIYGQPLEFDAVKVYADGGVQIDIDPENDSRATVSSAMDPTVEYVIRLSSGDHAVTVVYEGDIGDVKIVPDNADAVAEFHDRLVAGEAGTAVVSDEPPEPPEKPANSMTVDDTALWEDAANGDIVFHDARSGTANDPVPEGWNIYGQPLEFDAVRVYADGGLLVDVDPEDDSRATVTSALDPTVEYVIRLSSGEESVTVRYEGDIGDVKIVPDNADAVAGFRDRLVAGAEGTAVVSDDPPPARPHEPDLVVEAVSASDAAPAPGTSFTLSATVRNAGGATAAATVLRYYRSADAAIGTSDTEVGTDAVDALAASATSPQSISLAAPNTPGTYHYGACVDAVADESDTADNCSAAVRVVIADPSAPPADEPDLVVESVSASDAAPAPGAAFTLSATVRNAGGAAAAATVLRYYRSADAAIDSSDTEVGTDAVAGLSPSATSPHSIPLDAPGTAGTYHYGACVDAVADETYTADNCSAAVRVDVGGASPPGAPDAPTVTLNGAGTHLSVVFIAPFAARETKAFDIRLRQKDQRSVSQTYCGAATNERDDPIQGRVTATVFIASFVQAETTYLVDYRHIGASCSDDLDNPWSATAEFTTPGSSGDGDFDIDIAYVGNPSSSLRTAVDSAASTWERAITSDPVDIDFSGRPVNNSCTDGAFDGVVDDVRIYVYVQSIDGAGGVLASAGVCTARSVSYLPVISVVTFDSADTERLGSTRLYDTALHEVAHALGFGTLWGGLLVNPSLKDGEPVTPPPDTHFNGSNAITAFDDAGGTDYQGGKVPVENERGGSGSQDGHWRKSVMDSELMTYSLGASAPFSAITIQSMADLGYEVDDSVADSYTVANISAQALAARADEPLRPNCLIRPPTDIEIVPAAAANALPSSGIRMEIVYPVDPAVSPH